MSDKKGRSEERTDWFGDKYVQHYDEDGNKTGRSEEKTDWFGDKYTQHYDESSNKTERSEEKTDWFGDEYTQHYDESSNKTGRSEEKTDWFGDEYTQHYDQSDNKTGRSEEKIDWFGDKYVQHYDSSSRAGTSSRISLSNPGSAPAEYELHEPSNHGGSHSTSGGNTSASSPGEFFIVAIVIVGFIIAALSIHEREPPASPRMAHDQASALRANKLAEQDAADQALNDLMLQGVPSLKVVEGIAAKGARPSNLLLQALIFDRRDVAELALRLGARVNDSDGIVDAWSPMFFNARSVSMLEPMMAHGANLTATNYLGQSVLHVYTDPEMIRIALAVGVSPAVVDKNSATALSLVKDRRRHFVKALTEGKGRGNPSIVEYQRTQLKNADAVTLLLESAAFGAAQ